MSTPYTKLYENILPKFRSYELALMSEEDAEDYLHDFISPAISQFHVCRTDLTDRDEENKCFNEDLSDTEIEILGNYMLLEYIDSTYIRVPSLLKATLSSTDFNAFSNANLLDKLLAMQHRYLSENETLLSRYAWMGAIDSGAAARIGNGYRKNHRVL